MCNVTFAICVVFAKCYIQISNRIAIAWSRIRNTEAFNINCQALRITKQKFQVSKF